MTPRTAIVLLSGGMDSTIALFWAKQKFNGVTALAFNYGQRHARELWSASQVARRAQVNLQEVRLHDVRLGASSLTREGRPVTDAASTVTPGRNLFFLLAAGVVAWERGGDTRDLVVGACLDDRETYPDCRRSFLEKASEAIGLALGAPITIHAPLLDRSKVDALRLARRLPDCWGTLALTHSCYVSDPPCLACPACLARARGFSEAGEKDPSLS